MTDRPRGPDASRHARGVGHLEFWPEHGQGPLWTDDGAAVDLRSLGLPDALADGLAEWNAAYAEDKIPVDGAGDATWLARGRELLGLTRQALGPGHRVEVTEPWWGETPSA